MVSNYSKSLLYFQLISITLLCFTITQNLYSQFTIVTIASDDANTNYGGGFGDGSNGGSGFGAWSITYGSSTGTFTGSPGSDGMNTATIGSNAWAFYSTGSGGNYVNATRPFSQAMAVGDIFTFDWAMNWDANAGNKGFDLMAGSSSVFNVNNGGSSTITAGGVDANTNYGTNAMTVTVSRTSGSEYSFTMTSRSGGSAYTTTISSSSAIDALKIYSGDQNDGSGNRNIYFNNFEITRSSTSATLTGSAGWRLLASPSTTTYQDLLGPIWTQGIPNSDAYDGTDDPAPNVYLWNSTAWGAVTNLNETISAGSGFLVYVFQDDDYTGSSGSTTFPKTLSVTGSENATGTSPTINSSADGWTLLGNPFASTIDFDNLTTNKITDVAYVYNPDSSAWVSWNGTIGDLTGGLIAPFQGFFVQTDSEPSSPSVSFPAAAKTSGGSFRGKITTTPVAFRLELQGKNLSNSTWIAFSDAGSFEHKVMGDAVELQPLSSNYAQLAILKNDHLLDIAHLSIPSDSYLVPLEISSTEDGFYSLEFSRGQLPPNTEIIFTDNQTGFSSTIDESFTYSFELNKGTAAKFTDPKNILPEPIKAKAYNSSRFTLLVSPVESVTNELNDVTENSFSLYQNYPNPFNPNTSIKYSIPKDGPVQLKVYNLIGHEVEILVNSYQQAGKYSVQWNASEMASGIYYYKLETANESVTKKMTLIK